MSSQNELLKLLSKTPQTKLTTLPNGFTVASELFNSKTASVGVFIRTGSRQENVNNNGTAHFLEHMYFKTTQKRSFLDLVQEFERTGSDLNAHTSREYTVFLSHCLSKQVISRADVLHDMLMNPLFNEGDIQLERITITQELEECLKNIYEDLFNVTHREAYKNHPLGFTIIGPRENIDSKITKETMMQYRAENYLPERMVLVAAGDVNHDELVQFATEKFGKIPRRKLILPEEKKLLIPTPQQAQNLDLKAERKKNPIFHSGNYFEYRDLPVVHSTIGFEAPGVNENDVFVIGLLQIMLGSFDSLAISSTATNPLLGATMSDNELISSFSKRSSSVRKFEFYNHSYSDRSLVGFHLIVDNTKGALHKRKNNPMIACLKELTKFCYSCPGEKLEKAKNLLKLRLLTTYEGDLSQVLEEFGRQLLFYGRRMTFKEFWLRVDSITPEDVMRVCTEYFYDKQPLVVALGRLNEKKMIDSSILAEFTSMSKKIKE